MTGWLTGYTGYCSLFERACRLLEAARLLYREIVEPAMGYSRVREVEAAYYASHVASGAAVCRFLEWAFRNIPERRVCVVGPLYGLSKRPRGCDVVVGVEQVALWGLECDLVSGDLDVTRGRITEDPAGERFRLVHIHGDNYEHVLSWSPVDGERVVYTSQAYCAWPVLGIGGFTDGDRLVLLAMAFGAREVALYGFNLHSPTCVGKMTCDLEYKARKLRLASILLGEYARIYGYRIVEEHLSPDAHLITLFEKHV